MLTASVDKTGDGDDDGASVVAAAVGASLAVVVGVDGVGGGAMVLSSASCSFCGVCSRGVVGAVVVSADIGGGGGSVVNSLLAVSCAAATAACVAGDASSCLLGTSTMDASAWRKRQREKERVTTE